MKPFVSSDLEAADWGLRRPGGRVRWLGDLWGFVLPIVGAVTLAEILGLFESGRVVRFLLAGLAFGAVAGRTIVVWRERGGDELSSRRVRRIEVSWVLIGFLVALLLCLFASPS